MRAAADDARAVAAAHPTDATPDAVRAGATVILPPDEWRTSATDPYDVDWIDLRQVPGLEDAPGALGMSFAPGKVDAYWKQDRDLAADLDALRAVHHVDTLVLLIEDGELVDLQITELPEAAASAGLELLRYPIPDFGVPAESIGFGHLVADLLARIRSGQRVVVACKGGYGRTGTVTGVLLRAAGVDPAEAVSLVRASRPGTIESATQAAYVADWAGDEAGPVARPQGVVAT